VALTQLQLAIESHLRLASPNEAVRVAGMTDAPIPWPHTLVKGGRPMILCGDLVKAIRVESAVAMKHHFGVGSDTVWKWRKKLGVDTELAEKLRCTPQQVRWRRLQLGIGKFRP